jgi:hypothetical protein
MFPGLRVTTSCDFAGESQSLNSRRSVGVGSDERAREFVTIAEPDI